MFKWCHTPVHQQERQKIHMNDFMWRDVTERVMVTVS